MTPAEAMVAAIRYARIDLFIILRNGPVEGVAWVEDGRRLINVCGDGLGLDVARVLAHELAHHALHMDRWTTMPHWQKELQAEALALEFLSGFVTLDEMETLVVGAKTYLRPKVQAFLDHGITAHGETHVGRWLRCEMREYQPENWCADWPGYDGPRPWLDGDDEVPF